MPDWLNSLLIVSIFWILLLLLLLLLLLTSVFPIPLVTQGLRTLLMALEKRELGKYTLATGLMGNSAYAFVEFAEQLRVFPEFSTILLEDFANEVMALIKSLAVATRVAIDRFFFPSNGLAEFKAAGLLLAARIRQFIQGVRDRFASMDLL